jgi:hypothetical protein
MYNCRMQPHEMATVSQLKRIGRWVVSEECYPDPNRYPFTEMTAVSADGNLVKFRRMLMGCVLVTAGVVVMAGKRDDGAGAKDLKAPHRPQWANANVARDLLAQLEEKRDETSDAEYGHVCTALATALCSPAMLSTTRPAPLRSLPLTMQGKSAMTPMSRALWGPRRRERGARTSWVAGSTGQKGTPSGAPARSA